MFFGVKTQTASTIDYVTLFKSHCCFTKDIFVLFKAFLVTQLLLCYIDNNVPPLVCVVASAATMRAPGGRRCSMPCSSSCCVFGPKFDDAVKMVAA